MLDFPAVTSLETLDLALHGALAPPGGQRREQLIPPELELDVCAPNLSM